MASTYGILYGVSQKPYEVGPIFESDEIIKAERTNQRDPFSVYASEWWRGGVNPRAYLLGYSASWNLPFFLQESELGSSLL